MPHDSYRRSATPTTLAQILLILTAVAAYALVMLSGVSRTLTSSLLSAVALAALSAALFAFVAARIGPVVQPRLGGRAQVARRRYNALMFAAVGAVYLTLVAGTLVMNAGGLVVCLALPVCATPDSLAAVTVAHRALAAIAGAFVLALVFQTWRTRSEKLLRRAAGWTLGLMGVQLLLGIVMVETTARFGDSGALVEGTRLAHLAAAIITWAALTVHMTLALRLPASATKAEPTPQAQISSRQSLLKDYVSLTKPGVISLLILTTIASMYITPAGMPSLVLVFWTFVGGWLMASGAHSVNCWADRDIDINMGRTSRRPIPSGRIPAWHALVLGIVLGALAFAILFVFVNLAAALLSLAGYFYYVLIYTRWLKRSTPSNIVIGGGAGAFPPLVGWAAATGGLTLGSLLLFAIIFYWTPPHFWALALIREKDYARASVPMLPVVAGENETKRQIILYSVMMVALTILPAALHMFGFVYLALAVLFGGLFLRYAVQLWQRGTTAAAWGLYKYSLLYLALLFAGMVLDRMLAFAV